MNAASQMRAATSLVDEEPSTGLVPTTLSALPPDRHPALVYLARLAPGSRPTMAQALDVIAAVVTGGQADHRTLPWHHLGYQHTQAVRTALGDRYSPATANKMLSALRAVLKECWRLGLLTAEGYQRAADLETVRGETLPAGRALSSGELRALFATCSDDPTPGDVRDAALLVVLYGAGLRRSEVVALDVTDYDPASGALAVRSGKGRKGRVVYATNGAAEALTAWLAVRGDDQGPLLLPVNKGGRLQHRRLTTQAVYAALERRARAAGIPTFSPHDLRRTMIGDLLDLGADISTVQKLAGHASVSTTARYDRRPEAAKQKAAGMLHVPYTPSA